MLEQVLLCPRDDVARFVEWLAVDEQAGNLAFSADGDECLLGIGIGRDIALGNGHAVIGKETLDLYARRYEKAIWVASPAAQLLSAGSGCHNGL